MTDGILTMAKFPASSDLSSKHALTLNVRSHVGML